MTRWMDGWINGQTGGTFTWAISLLGFEGLQMCPCPMIACKQWCRATDFVQVCPGFKSSPCRGLRPFLFSCWPLNALMPGASCFPPSFTMSCRVTLAKLARNIKWKAKPSLTPPETLCFVFSCILIFRRRLLIMRLSTNLKIKYSLSMTTGRRAHHAEAPTSPSAP